MAKTPHAEPSVGSSTVSLEEQIIASRATHAGKIASIVKDANDNPGYYHLSLRTLLSRDPERRAWVKAANAAVRTGQVKRNLTGHFYPADYRYPTLLESLAMYRHVFAAAAWLALYVAIFVTVMTYGPAILLVMGVWGYAVGGLCCAASFFVAVALYGSIARY